MFEDKLARERPLAAAGHCRDFALEKWSRVWVSLAPARHRQSTGLAWLMHSRHSFLQFPLVAAGGGRPRGGIWLRNKYARPGLVRARPATGHGHRPQARLRWWRLGWVQPQSRAPAASVSLAAVRWLGVRARLGEARPENPPSSSQQPQLAGTDQLGSSEPASV